MVHLIAGPARRGARPGSRTDQPDRLWRGGLPVLNDRSTYRNRGGRRASILSDFFIGAHRRGARVTAAHPRCGPLPHLLPHRRRHRPYLTCRDAGLALVHRQASSQRRANDRNVAACSPDRPARTSTCRSARSHHRSIPRCWAASAVHRHASSPEVRSSRVNRSATAARPAPSPGVLPAPATAQATSSRATSSCRMLPRPAR